MQKGINQFFVFMTVFAVVVTSFITPTTAYADDGTTTGGETSEPAVVEEQEPAVEEAAPVETVEEIMEQIPDSTELVVLDETGTPEPLASQAAADIIVNGDPMWCPDGVLPGGAGCTPAFTYFGDETDGSGGLLEELFENPGTYSGVGTIYVAQTYDSSLEGGNDVDINGTNLTSLGNLTIQGGWDFGLNSLAGTSTFTGISLNIFNWTGSVTLNDLVINTTNTGLYVQSDDNIVLDNVDAQSSNFYGAYLDNADSLSATVQITDSDFSDTGTLGTADDGGLFVLSNGDVTLTNVTSSDHQNYGAVIYGNNVSVTNGTFNNQSVDSGLWVNSLGNITLNNVIASNNYYEGAILDATYGTGDITVTNSTFDDNGEYGLAAGSFGNILLDNVIATNNAAYGAYLSSLGMGNITVTDSTFSQNGVKGLYADSSGDITLDNVVVSDNGSYGAYLEAYYGTGNIFVTNSTFNGNGSVGLAAMTGEGNITIDNIFVDGAGTTDIGAYLGTYDGGAVNISDSTFQNMTGYGLKIGSGGPVTLTNVTASNNGSHGAFIFNPYACDGLGGIDVTVDGGTYQNNGGYGLYVSPGPLGTLTFGTASTFGGNGLGDYLLDLVVNCTHEDHPKPPETPKKPINVVELPSTGGDPVEQDCEIYSGTELILPNGTHAFIDCPFNGDSLIEEVGFDGLPSPLPTGPEFVSGVSLDFNATADEEGKTEEAAITLSFDIPEGMEGKLFSILYWDPEANDGLGDWVELPMARSFGDSKFPLHPDDPDDLRMSSGVEIVDGKVTVTVNFPGTFVLVAR